MKTVNIIQIYIYGVNMHPNIFVYPLIVSDKTSCLVIVGIVQTVRFCNM